MRILSVQSHVVSGYVGNKNAAFSLQLLGFEVDCINSVQFSNHGGYEFKTGKVMSDSELHELMKGLEQNKLDNYTHLITGYVHDAGFLRALGEIVKKLRNNYSNLTFLCDPVLGDNGRVYVPKELLSIYRNEILPLANIITPNQFEIEIIADQKINSIDDALKAMDYCHDMGIEIVLISSLTLPETENIIALASRKTENERQILKMTVPQLPIVFTGCGDLTAAVFLGWFLKTDDLKMSLEITISTLHAVLKRTLEHTIKSEGDSMASKELKVIQSKEEIEKPKSTFKAELINLKG